MLNLHERVLPVPLAAAGSLLDAVETRLWPSDRWPALHFDRPLGVGATGGHGPIGYSVEAYHPGQLIRCRFNAPAGFDGYHELSLLPEGRYCRLRHLIRAQLHGSARLLWPLAYEPLHDALIEDLLDRAERELTREVQRPARWSRRVKVLRSWLK